MLYGANRLCTDSSFSTANAQFRLLIEQPANSRSLMPIKQEVQKEKLEGNILGFVTVADQFVENVPEGQGLSMIS